MTTSPRTWQPQYTITSALARHLMDVEAARAIIAHTPLTPKAQAELRRRARLRSTHYSTRIEGNRLSLEETEHAISEATSTFRGRERDVLEVRNYWNALIRIEEWAAAGRTLTEELIRKVHALVERGPKAKPTPYRDGQNVIRDSVTGTIVYMPPEAKDVPGLMQALVKWVHEDEMNDTPVPIIAGLAHYQFVTIHPYFDGNGRTARLLATFILHRGGYGLNGFFSLEEHHARDLSGYYRALTTHPHHNYYEGRADVDLTPWVEYFLSILTRVFKLAEEEALHMAQHPVPPESEAVRRLDHRARIVLELFAETDQITTAQVAQALGLSDRMARNLIQEWVEQGWLLVAEPSRRKRAYSLSAIYRQYIGNLSAIAG